MGHALLLYGVASILFLASAGAVVSEVRDASLEEFALMKTFRPMEEFPFLDKARPYLPPIVVEWVVVQRGGQLDLPPGGSWRLDKDGTVIVVMPDGCEVPEEQWLETKECVPPLPPCEDGGERDEDGNCPGPCNSADEESQNGDCIAPPVQCNPGQVRAPAGTPGDPDCIPDPACELPPEDPERPAGCPAPPPPPPPTCDDNQVLAYDGTCIPIETTRLRGLSFVATDTRNVDVELKVAYENLSLELVFEGVPQPEWTVKLFYSDGTTVCWRQGSGNEMCSVTQPGSIGAGSASYNDTVNGDIRAGHLTLHVEFVVGPGPAVNQASLEVSLYGKPADPDA